MKIAAKGVSYSYRRHKALKDVDWCASRGVTGLLGPNGAGKSTLLGLVATIERPQQGQLHFGQHDMNTMRGRAEARRQVGYLPQHFSLVPSMTVLDTVAYVAWLHSMPRRESFKAAVVALGMVGLMDVSSRRVRELSGGSRQRVGIAAAIAHDPAVIVLDEPTAGLDPSQRLDLRQRIHALGEEKTVILATHLIEDVTYLCDEVTVLAGGEVRFHGTPAQLANLAAQTNVSNRRGSTIERAYAELLVEENWGSG